MSWKNDSNWQEAFAYANFSIKDVKKVLHSDDGYNDGDPWIMVGRLKNGDYFFLSAGCDYTGWDCQAGGYSHTEQDLETLYRFRLGEEDRRRLNIILKD